MTATNANNVIIKSIDKLIDFIEKSSDKKQTPHDKCKRSTPIPLAIELAIYGYIRRIKVDTDIPNDIKQLIMYWCMSDLKLRYKFISIGHGIVKHVFKHRRRESLEEKLLLSEELKVLHQELFEEEYVPYDVILQRNERYRQDRRRKELQDIKALIPSKSKYFSDNDAQEEIYESRMQNIWVWWI